MNKDELERAAEWTDRLDPRTLLRRKDDSVGVEALLFYIARKVQIIEERQRLPFWKRWL